MRPLAGLLVLVAALAGPQAARAQFSPVSSWGSPGAGPGQFLAPVGIATDGAGTIYVSDAAANRVQLFYADGSLAGEFGRPGAGAGEFAGAGHVAADAFGSVYVADPGNARVQKFSAAGAFQFPIGMRGSFDGQFQAPAGVAVDAVGGVYVVDAVTGRIQRFTSDGSFDRAWDGSAGGQPLGAPVDVAIDGDGDVYVLDREGASVRRFSSDGASLPGWGSPGARPSQFDEPRGIATDGAGNVYVADTGNHRVQAFNADGAFIGEFSAGPSSNPVDVAADGSGVIHVLDGMAAVHSFAAPVSLPPPDAGRTANIKQASGVVLVRRRGQRRFTRLVHPQQIPVGSLVQATHGVALLTTASGLGGGQQTARVYDGMFRVKQDRSLRPVTVLQLAGGDDPCPQPRASLRAGAAVARARTRSKRVRRQLWADGKGRFHTHGRRGAAGVRGTMWLTQDRCDGTRFYVQRGVLAVYDFVRRKNLILREGQSYVARAP